MKYIKKSISSAALALLLSTSSFADCSYELFTISSTQNTKIIDFVNQLSDECGLSIIVTDPNAEKFLNTTLNKTNLKNLTINEVLDIILLENNLSYTLKDNLLKISYLTTKVFEIDYILSQRKSTGSTDITLSSNSASSSSIGGAAGGISGGGAAGGISGGTSGGINGTSGGGAGGSTAQSGIRIESSDQVKFWEELDGEFENVLNRPTDTYKASKPIINKNAGLITITATARQMKRFENYLKRLQGKVQLQVLIDVQLLTVTMNEGKTTGIDWQQLYALQNIKIDANWADNQGAASTTATTGTAAAVNTVNGVSHAINLKSSVSLNQVIKFLKTQGSVNSISNPKVLTLNNQPALITSGTEYFYTVKSSQNQQGTGGGIAATTQNNNIQSVFAGVLLTITPEISDDKSITLKINPSLSETTKNIAAQDNSNRVTPPDLNRRQLSSVVTVKDGNRIILGGLITTKMTTKENKVPLLGDIPIVSYLFKYEEKVKQVQELVIVIEPHIIHKEKNTVSLSDLGYSGIDNKLLLHENLSINKTQEKKKKNEEKDNEDDE